MKVTHGCYMCDRNATSNGILITHMQVNHKLHIAVAVGLFLTKIHMEVLLTQTRKRTYNDVI